MKNQNDIINPLPRMYHNKHDGKIYECFQPHWDGDKEFIGYFKKVSKQDGKNNPIRVSMFNKKSEIEFYLIPVN